MADPAYESPPTKRRCRAGLGRDAPVTVLPKFPAVLPSPPTHPFMLYADFITTAEPGHVQEGNL